MFSLYVQDSPDQFYFGVYDGHVGIEAATYSAVHLHHNIVRHSQFASDPVLAIKEAVRLTDERYCQKVHIVQRQVMCRPYSGLIMVEKSKAK